jgi:glycosyltransferase involved in cell wall biosynthesis
MFMMHPQRRLPGGSQSPGPLYLEGDRGTRRPVVGVTTRVREIEAQIGNEAYSYYFVYRAFESLLARWGELVEITADDQGVRNLVQACRTRDVPALHLSFLPLQFIPGVSLAPTVGFPFWEFPDIPNEDFPSEARQNWVAIARELGLILTASRFTQEAFQRAGVRTPVHVVPVPVRKDYFEVPAWSAEQRVVLECPNFPLPLPPGFSWDPPQPPLLARGYKRFVRPWIPAAGERFLRRISGASRTGPDGSPETSAAASGPVLSSAPACGAPSQHLDFHGIVYASVLNTYDCRKNWKDLVKAYLVGLADEPDALLILKLVASPRTRWARLQEVFEHYSELGIRHRCRLALISEYLTDEQMVELARGSTYYVNNSRAEGACLPLQDFLAAGRPAIAPAHSALADYFDGSLGYVVASHPEPMFWPHDPRRKYLTTWYPTDWKSLANQFRRSFRTARREPRCYESQAACARERIQSFASAEQVWPRLAGALDSLCSHTSIAA